MRFEMFIAVDGDHGVIREGGHYSYTVTGAVMFQLGTVLPLIEKRRGCFGLGKVEGFATNGNVTEVKFQALGDISSDAKKAYYTLYQLNAGVRVEDDEFDSGDQYIPGSMALNRGGKQMKNSTNRNSNSGNRLGRGIFSD